MKFVVRVKSNMGQIRIPHLKQAHAADASTKAKSDAAYIIELKKALKKSNPENWKGAYVGGKIYKLDSLPENFKVLESGFFITIEITI